MTKKCAEKVVVVQLQATVLEAATLNLKEVPQTRFVLHTMSRNDGEMYVHTLGLVHGAEFVWVVWQGLCVLKHGLDR